MDTLPGTTEERTTITFLTMIVHPHETLVDLRSTKLFTMRQVVWIGLSIMIVPSV